MVAGRLFMTHALAIVLDCLLVLFVGIMALIGIKKGFFKGLVGVFGLILIVVLTAALSNVIAMLLDRAFGSTQTVIGWLTRYFNSFAGFKEVVKDGELAAAIAEKLGMPTYLVHLVVDKLVPVTVSEGQTISQALAATFGPLFMNFVVGTILFISQSLLLSVCTKLFTKAVEGVPMLNYSNGFLGMALGVIKGMIIVALVAYVLSFIPYDKVQSVISQSAIFSKISEYVVPRLSLVFMP